MEEVATPEWFDDAFVEKVLRKGLKQNEVQVLETETKMAAEAGDNYGSKLFRCRVKTTSPKKDGENGNKPKEISVIVKMVPPGVMEDELKKLSFFEKEMQVLSTILPKMTEILRGGRPEVEDLGPECYYHEGSPHTVMVMEDLREKKFTMADRIEGLDLDHAKLVLRGMARYHAASIVMRKQAPEMLEMFKSSIWYGEDYGTPQKFLDRVLSALIDDFPTWNQVERKEALHEKLKNLKKIAVERVNDIFRPDENRMNVLLHGDPWVNNFMFRYDASSGKPVEIRFIDFQMCTLNTPAVDLQYFIHTSTREDVKFAQVDTCLKIYHREFEETLNKLNFVPETPYGFDRLKEDFDKTYFWGLVVFCCIFPLFKIPTGETIDPEKLFTGEKSDLENMFNRESVRKILTNGLLRFEQKGTF